MTLSASRVDSKQLSSSNHVNDVYFAATLVLLHIDLMAILPSEVLVLASDTVP